MKNIFLHIGTHKTGSTSIQAFLQKESKLLNNEGFEFYQGIHLKKNHVELFLSTMRENRDSFAKDKFNTGDQDSYFQMVQDKVHRFINESEYENLIFSTEGLSLLRFNDELIKLKTILKANEIKLTTILYFRNKFDFLESYKKQIKKRDRSFSDKPESVYYVKNDSWLIDYDNLKKAYTDAFGLDNLIVIDYDSEMHTHNNILPSFIKVLGITEYPKHIENKYFKNITDKKSASVHKKKHSIITRIISKLRSF